MPASFGVVYPLWAHAQQGSELLDRILGEIGPDHLCVPVVTGAVREVRFESADAPHLFLGDGGWHYPPERSRYAGNAARIRAAAWTGKKNWLDPLRNEAQRRGIALRFRVDLRSAGALGPADEHLLARNAWGEPDSGLGPCVSSPLLRDLLRETLDELITYQPDAFQIVDWLPGPPALAAHAFPGCIDELLPLYSICFCPACREIAAAARPATPDAPADDDGLVDPDLVARSVEVQLAQAAAADPADASRRQDPLTTRYVDALARSNADWLGRLAQRHAPRALHLLGNFDALQSPRAALADDVRPLVRLPAATAPLQDWLRSRPRADAGVSMPCWRPAFVQGQELNRCTQQLVDAGACCLDFEGLHTAPSLAVDWLRQAVRYARRR